MSSRNNKTPVKNNYPTTAKTTSRSPTPIPHVTSTMVPDPANQNNLNIALQLAEHHKKQAYLYKEKCEMLQTKMKQKQNMIENMDSNLESANKDNEKLVKKYKKLKTKYKSLCQEQQMNEIEEKQKSHKNYTPREEDEYEQPSPIFQKYKENNNTETNPSSECMSLMHELSQKNRTISMLCEKVQECEENTLQIFKLVNVLEQRVQELSMDNNLLRGVVRQKCRLVSANSRQVTLD